MDWKTQPETLKTPARWIPTKEPMNVGYDVGLTMSVKVCPSRQVLSASGFMLKCFLGSALGQDEGGRSGSLSDCLCLLLSSGTR